MTEERGATFEAGKRYCSFCGKSQDDVQAMGTSRFASICNACISLAADIVAAHVVRLKREDANPLTTKETEE